MSQKYSTSTVPRELFNIDLCIDLSGTVYEANVNTEQSGSFQEMIHGRKMPDTMCFPKTFPGISSIAHGFVAARLRQNLYGTEPSLEMLLLWQVILGAEFLQNHIRHFYLHALPDYLDSDLFPDFTPSQDLKSSFTPWQQRNLVEHYFTAMACNRKIDEILTIIGGKNTYRFDLTPGETPICPDALRRKKLLSLLEQIQSFIQNVMYPDVNLLARVYPAYLQIGTGTFRYISFGLFDPRLGGHFPAGIVRDRERDETRVEEILDNIFRERNTTPDETLENNRQKNGVHAPRYRGLSLEGGPLARKIIREVISPGGTYTGPVARLMARVEEAALISTWMEDWVRHLPERDGYIIPLPPRPVFTRAVSTHDVPRGPSLHAMEISGETVASYRIITPCHWNFSSKDKSGNRGPVEEALTGAVVDPAHPVEACRIVRSFDPCLPCSIHVVSPKGKRGIKMNLSCES